MVKCWNCTEMEATWELINKQNPINSNELQAKVCDRCKNSYQVNPMQGDEWVVIKSDLEDTKPELEHLINELEVWMWQAPNFLNRDKKLNQIITNMKKLIK